MKMAFRAAALVLPMLLGNMALAGAGEAYNPAKDLLKGNGTLETARADEAVRSQCEFTRSMLATMFAVDHELGAQLSFYYTCNAVSSEFFQKEVVELVPQISREMKITEKAAQDHLRKVFVDHEMKVCGSFVRNKLTDTMPNTYNNLCNAIGHPAYKNTMK